MKIFLVGGAVRDRLLGLAVHERDWVVVGASPDNLLAQGFKPVGSDFPVFIHPETGEEYALARTERKDGHGYKGFKFYAAPDVTLEQDLGRRDLTVNAIAEDGDGNITDPFNGRNDLKKRVLRHVSPAFSEDPLRVLRLARFAAYLPEFTIDPVTSDLAHKLAQSGELSCLTAERVWVEIEKACALSNCAEFFQVMASVGGWSGLDQSLGNLDSYDWRNWGSVWGRMESSLQRFSGLGMMLNQDDVQALARFLRLPKVYARQLRLVSQLGGGLTHFPASGEEVYNLLQRADAWRNSEGWLALVKVALRFCEDDEVSESLQNFWERALVIGCGVCFDSKRASGSPQEYMLQERTKALEDLVAGWG